MQPHDTPIAIYKWDRSCALANKGSIRGISGEQGFDLVGLGVHAAVLANLPSFVNS